MPGAGFPALARQPEKARVENGPRHDDGERRRNHGEEEEKERGRGGGPEPPPRSARHRVSSVGGSEALRAATETRIEIPASHSAMAQAPASFPNAVNS